MSFDMLVSYGMQFAHLAIAFAGFVFCLTQTRYSWRLWLLAAAFASVAAITGINFLLCQFLDSIASGLQIDNMTAIQAMFALTGTLGLMSSSLFIVGLWLFLQEFRRRGHSDERL